jgi:polyhydroxyalkanoate synthase
MSKAKAFNEMYDEVLSRINTLDVKGAPSKYDVIDELDIFKLLHYQPLTEEKYKTPILIVSPFINRPYVLDMNNDISVIQKYLQAGFDVYMIDWGYPTPANRVYRKFKSEST